MQSSWQCLACAEIPSGHEWLDIPKCWHDHRSRVARSDFSSVALSHRTWLSDWGNGRRIIKQLLYKSTPDRLGFIGNAQLKPAAFGGILPHCESIMADGAPCVRSRRISISINVNTFFAIQIGSGVLTYVTTTSSSFKYRLDYLAWPQALRHYDVERCF